MKRLALAFALTVGAASAALAADLPTPGPIPPPIYAPAVAYNWTGFYIGGNLGLGWNGGSFADSIGNTFSLDPKTLFLGGGQAGLIMSSAAAFLSALRLISIGFPAPRAAATPSCCKIRRVLQREVPVRWRSIIGG